jgi:hypothetical protein
MTLAIATLVSFAILAPISPPAKAVWLLVPTRHQQR